MTSLIYKQLADDQRALPTCESEKYWLFRFSNIILSKMIEEVNFATEFMKKFMKRNLLSSEKIDEFVSCLTTTIKNYYLDHWFPDQPNKGNGYRCIRIVSNKVDPLLSKAGRCCGLSDKILLQMFPAEFTMWIDPDEVSYRIGDEGSIGVVFNSDSRSNSECDDSSSESDTSESISPCSTPVRPVSFASAPVMNPHLRPRYGMYYQIPTLPDWPLTVAFVQ